MTKVLVTDTYLEDIADAIRDKTGGSDTYTPSQMATAINNLSTKVVLPTQGICFAYSNSSSAITNLFNSLDTSQVWRFDNFFRGSGNSGNNLDGNPPLFDTSNGVFFYGMFYYQTLITSIPQYNTSKGKDFRQMFYNCLNLETLPILDLSKAEELSEMFSNCINLSNDSLNNILYMLANATTYAGTKTLAYVGLSSSQATTCTGLSNYDDFVNAGWITGY